MPTISSYADLINDWDRLLSACEENGHLLPGYNIGAEPLVGLLEEVKGLKVVQDRLEGNRQATTQEINERCDDGREAARRLRSFIRSRLGTRSEHLPMFGVAPIRARGRRSLKPPPPPPPPPVEDVKAVETVDPQE